MELQQALQEATRETAAVTASHGRLQEEADSTSTALKEAREALEEMREDYQCTQAEVLHVLASPSRHFPDAFRVLCIAQMDQLQQDLEETETQLQGKIAELQASLHNAEAEAAEQREAADQATKSVQESASSQVFACHALALACIVSIVGLAAAAVGCVWP